MRRPAGQDEETGHWWAIQSHMHRTLSCRRTRSGHEGYRDETRLAEQVVTMNRLGRNHNADVSHRRRMPCSPHKARHLYALRLAIGSESQLPSKHDNPNHRLYKTIVDCGLWIDSLESRERACRPQKTAEMQGSDARWIPAFAPRLCD